MNIAWNVISIEMLTKAGTAFEIDQQKVLSAIQSESKIQTKWYSEMKNK